MTIHPRESTVTSSDAVRFGMRHPERGQLFDRWVRATIGEHLWNRRPISVTLGEGFVDVHVLTVHDVATIEKEIDRPITVYPESPCGRRTLLTRRYRVAAPVPPPAWPTLRELGRSVTS